jgi:hypothetical protein
LPHRELVEVRLEAGANDRSREVEHAEANAMISAGRRVPFSL